MKSLSQFLVENLIPIMELSSATYKSAADKAVIKKQFDRAGKFMGAFFKAVEDEKLSDGSYVPDKYKGLKHKLEKIAPFTGDIYRKSISVTVDGIKCKSGVSIRSLYDKDTNLYGNVVINLKEFAKLSDKLEETEPDYWARVMKLKEKGLFYNNLIKGVTNDLLKNTEVLIPLKFSLDHDSLSEKIKKGEISEEDDKKYNTFCLTAESLNGINFYDPDNDVFFYISCSGREIIKYDIDKFPTNLEFESPIYNALYGNFMKILSDILRIINPNSKFITK